MALHARRAGDSPQEPGAWPQLAGKIAFVTGGARGLGAAICRSLAEAGTHVVAADVRSDMVEETAAALGEAGYRAEAVALDVSDNAAVEAALARIARRHGGVDIVINNAGIDRTVSIEEMTPQEWSHIIAVNLTGPFLVSRHALPFMRARGAGHIVNIVSTAAKRAWPNASAYHASKWGLLGFSHALHVEARPHNIKVTAVISGGLRTPFLLDRFPDIDVRNLQDPRNVADTVRSVLTLPPESVIPEIMVLPMRETSWP